MLEVERTPVLEMRGRPMKTVLKYIAFNICSANVPVQEQVAFFSSPPRRTARRLVRALSSIAVERVSVTARNFCVFEIRRARQ